MNSRRLARVAVHRVAGAPAPVAVGPGLRAGGGAAPPAGVGV